MRFYRCLSILSLFVVSTTMAYADWDRNCLSACYSSRHDCRYCSYQCYRENNYNPGPNYSGDSTCLLQEENSNNYFNQNY